MTPFLSIDDDSLHCLLEKLSPTSVAALAQTGRRFADLCQKRLWNKIDLKVNSRRAASIIEALQRCQELGRLIKHVTLRDIDLTEGLQERADVILRALSNVNMLRLERPWQRWDRRGTCATPPLSLCEYIQRSMNADFRRPEHAQHMLASLVGANHPKICTVELFGDFTTSEILDVIALEGLQSLQVEDLEILRTTEAGKRASGVAQSLKTLCLIGSKDWIYEKRAMRADMWMVESHALLQLIAAAGRLESLKLWLPRSPDGFFSPADLNRTLQPLRAHLRALDLTDPYLLEWKGRLPGRLCLRDFEHLETLETMAVCWFATEVSAIDRLDMVAMLPQSLVRIKVAFSLGEGAFFTPAEALSICPSDVDLVPRDAQRWQWVQALLSAGKSILTNLREIVIEEEWFRTRNGNRNWNYDVYRWFRAGSVLDQSVQSEAAVQAAVRVRRARPRY